MVLHIQGSGRLNITEPTGAQRTIRVAFAGTNDQPYKSVGRWLLDQGLVRDATWPGISAWVAANPGRVNEMLWSNPRYVLDRKSTRLNSSHLVISYAVFCLKKKKKIYHKSSPRDVS